MVPFPDYRPSLQFVEIAKLPSNYNFEVHKTVWRVQQVRPSVSSVLADFSIVKREEGVPSDARRLLDVLLLDCRYHRKVRSLQWLEFDRPLTAFQRFTGAEVVVMGDVTYGACCIDDLTGAHRMHTSSQN